MHNILDTKYSSMKWAGKRCSAQSILDILDNMHCLLLAMFNGRGARFSEFRDTVPHAKAIFKL